MSQFIILTDLNRCVGCMSCNTACKTVNNVPIGNFWNKVLRIGPNPSYEGAIWPEVEWYYLPIQCQHCESPECVKVCPTAASHKTSDGSVQVDKAKCIGCQFCVMACPYNVRYLNDQERVVEKCTLCGQKIAQGELPQCVAECVGMAKWFGDIEEDPSMMGFRGGDESNVAESCMEFSDSDVYSLPDVGNHPPFRYILRGKKWQGGDV